MTEASTIDVLAISVLGPDSAGIYGVVRVTREPHSGDLYWAVSTLTCSFDCLSREVAAAAAQAQWGVTSYYRYEPAARAHARRATPAGTRTVDRASAVNATIAPSVLTVAEWLQGSELAEAAAELQESIQDLELRIAEYDSKPCLSDTEFRQRRKWRLEVKRLVARQECG